MTETRKHEPRAVEARLRKNVASAIRAGHPWVYRDALERVDCAPGTVVTVRDRDNSFVGRGVADAGPIAVRVWTVKNEPVDEALVARRVCDAVRLRERTMPPDTNAIRLVHGEGDRLGGVVCDRYGDVAVLRLDGAGVAPWRGVLVDAILAETRVDALLVKTGRRGETRVEVAHGHVPDALVEILEHGMRMPVDVHRGQKTGLFLDHRESRRTVRRVAEGMRVLNLYGYTGGFSIAAGLGGARKVETVDVAEGALELARQGWALNGLAPGLHETHAADVPQFLEAAREKKRAWDLIVSDPPSFAPNEASKPAAIKAYRRLHRECLKRLTEGGLLLAASCSSHVDREAFEGTLKDAAVKARVVIQVIGRWGAAPDHPRVLGFPEGDYLKVVLCRVSR
ncbi:MAG: class I SAM-dependent rRNA methyltransferase [Sandaracinaceae bacterium]|nr:class I SAM-dependent rRNA methyltransferase [Sandaracinaceae bacterium]